MKPYRACVVAVIINEHGQVFAGERADKPGVWQLPQGGIDDGESPTDTLFRELQEEIGCNDVEIIAQLDEKITYDFPTDMDTRISRQFRGQIQDWFLVKFKPHAVADLSVADGEFRDLAWKTAEELTASIVYWKQAAYKKGFQGLIFNKEK